MKMETVQNSISVKNSSREMIVIIVEHIFFVHNLEPGETFTLRASTIAENRILDLFDVDYQIGQVTIYMNNDKLNAYDLSYFVDNECISQQRF